jgi:hypothetical protein
MELAGLGAPSRWSRGSAAPASAGVSRRVTPLLPLLLLRTVEGGKKPVDEGPD